MAALGDVTGGNLPCSWAQHCDTCSEAGNVCHRSVQQAAGPAGAAADGQVRGGASHSVLTGAQCSVFSQLYLILQNQINIDCQL